MCFFALFSVRNTVQSDTSDAYRSYANLLRGCHCCFQTVTTITGHSPKPRSKLQPPAASRLSLDTDGSTTSKYFEAS